MRFTSSIIAAALSLAGGTNAWRQDPNGIWVASKELYRMNTSVIKTSGECAYYHTNRSRHMFKGNCTVYLGDVYCL
ncbi:uncharacterized protein B0H64DRAFT_443260 [Chaetomium fimeti]|uniref:Antifungal protein n=1 Tax=Chaetomium fimeti TaxID=1854472 RepID=A0AAE0HCV3_9PEZI|nr:hypothetical protein B0H64DRAFT_443260 [Chaetomium fimeti]